MCLQLFWRAGLSNKTTVKPSWTCPSHQCSTADHVGFWGLTRIQGWWDVCRSIAELPVGTLTSPCRAQPPVKALHVAWTSALNNRIKYQVCVCTISATQNLWIHSIGLKCLTLNSLVSDQPLARNPTDIERLITVKGIVIRCSDLTPAAWTAGFFLSPRGWDIPEEMWRFFLSLGWSNWAISSSHVSIAERKKHPMPCGTADFSLGDCFLNGRRWLGSCKCGGPRHCRWLSDHTFPDFEYGRMYRIPLIYNYNTHISRKVPRSKSTMFLLGIDVPFINLLSNQNVTQCRNAVEEKIHLPIHLQGHECCSLQMHHGRLQTWGASDAQPGLTAMWILEIQRRDRNGPQRGINIKSSWMLIWDFAEAWL